MLRTSIYILGISFQLAAISFELSDVSALSILKSHISNLTSKTRTSDLNYPTSHISILNSQTTDLRPQTSNLRPQTSDLKAPTCCFIWGINGHPLTQKDYNVSTWEEQISLLKDLDIDSYRVDVQLTELGYIKNESSYKTFIGKLTENKIMPFVVLSIGGIVTGTKENLYAQSFNQGKTFGSLYGEVLPVLEVGNEYDNKIILKGAHDGTKKSQYDEAKAEALMTKLNGFINGVKEARPNIKVSLSVGWVHYYYLQLLQESNVNYDIIGYHWYSNMGNIFNAKGYGNVLDTVSKRFDKPIWITEFNFRNGTRNGKNDLQKNYISQRGLELTKHKNVCGFFIYELLDEPAFKERNPDEAYYGLAYADSAGKIIKKSAYNAYKSIIGDYKSKNTPCPDLWKQQ